MTSDKDYYKILGVDREATPEVIKASYRALAKLYHPDIYKGDKNYAEVKIKEINEAYEVLYDHNKRNLYYNRTKVYQNRATTSKKNSNDRDNQNTSNTGSVKKPRPVITPKNFYFGVAKPGETLSTYFMITNEGGPYKNIYIDANASWITILDVSSMSVDNKLPLIVKIEVTGQSRNRIYSDNITIRLDDQETLFKVELSTKKPRESDKQKDFKTNGKYYYYNRRYKRARSAGIFFFFFITCMYGITLKTIYQHLQYNDDIPVYHLLGLPATFLIYTLFSLITKLINRDAGRFAARGQYIVGILTPIVLLTVFAGSINKNTYNIWETVLYIIIGIIILPILFVIPLIISKIIANRTGR